MEIKRLITQFTYAIAPKPEGGFIAHASDPNAPVLEAPTREELQQKIQATIMAGLSERFPGLKLPLQGQESKFSFHIESKPGGGFALHSADPGTQPVEGTQEQIESHFAEKIIGLAEKFSPELRQALESQGANGDVKVFVDRKTFTVKGGSRSFSLGVGRDLLPRSPLPSGGPVASNAAPGEVSNQDAASMGGTISNAPITPERSDTWRVFLLFLILMVIAALVYFFLYHR
ncbi:MAG TPA: hypothetical protein VJP04_09435 [Terriglobales bacterium]|nr:hypothetical protein [Terriglobales bacterium]